MNPREVIDFLLPQLNDPLQVGFLSIIVAIILGTVISTHIAANSRSWERKWNRGTPDDRTDDLDIEHGSVTDLWQAVSTTPEKLAEIMPSMLLVIGLLGTFLGLGIALNHASHILSQPDAMSANGAAQSMKDLVGLLQGLGTKFKTSTWGITGFVLIKFWSEITRFPEKRLAWVIGKVKTELESRKQAEAAADAVKQNALFVQIQSAANSITAGLGEQIQGAANAIAAGFSEQVQSARHSIAANFGEQIQGATNTITASLGEQTAQLIGAQAQTHEESRSRHDSYFAFVREGLKHLHAESRATNATMTRFTSGVEGVIHNMGDAAERMAAGADKVGDAANGLTNTVIDFKEQFTSALDRVSNDLGDAITKMSEQASETFERGSRQMESATNDISKALDGLSADVKHTMTEVQVAIGKAHEIQTKASIAFTTSSDELNENIRMSTERFSKLSEGLDQRLESVSEVGQRMNSIGRSLDKTLKGMDLIVEQLTALPATLAPLAGYAAEQHKTLKRLGELPDGQQALLSEFKGLREDMATAMTAAEQSHGSLANVE
jgi:hypothetical protein